MALENELTTDGLSGDQDLGSEGDSLSDLPDDITTLEELDKHLAGAGKEADETAPNPEIQELKGKFDELEQNNQLLLGIIQRLAAGKGAEQQAPKELNFFGDLEADDIPTTGQINNALVQLTQVVRQAIEGVTSDLHTRTSKKDFEEVTGEFLPALFKERPELSQAIQSGNMRLIQYHLADLFRALKSPKEKEVGDGISGDVARILKNLGKPGNPALSNYRAPVNKGQWVDNLDDKDFGKLIDRVISGTQRITRGG